MNAWDLMDRKAVGVGVAVGVILMGLGLAVVGTDPSATELRLATWPAAVIGLTVTALLVLRGFHRPDK